MFKKFLSSFLILVISTEGFAGNTTLTVSKQDYIDGQRPERNYVTNGNISKSVTGFVTYKDANQDLPVDGTGGIPSVTIAKSTTTPISGEASLVFTKASGTNLRGEGFSYNFSIDRSDQTQTLEISGKVQTVSSSGGGYTFGTGFYSDVIVYIFDVTNGVLIEPQGIKIDAPPVGSVANDFRATFQTAFNSTSYRLIFHVTDSTTTDGFELRFDDFYVGKQKTNPQASTGPVGEIIASGSATVPYGFFLCDGTTVSRTVFADLFQSIGTTYGVGDGSTTFNLPDLRGIFPRGAGSQTFGSQTYSTSLGTKQNDELESHNHSGGTSGPFSTTVATDATRFASNNNNSGTGWWMSGGNGQGTGASGGSETRPANQGVAYYIRWLPSVQLANVGDARTVVTQVNRSSTGLTNTYATVVFNTILNDTNAAYNTSTGVWTCPVSDYYRVSAQISFGSLTWGAGANVGIILRRDATDLFESFGSVSGAADTASNQKAATGSWNVFCNAGQTLTIRGRQTQTGGSIALNNDAAQNFFTIERLSGRSITTATDTVAASLVRPFGTPQSVVTATITPLAFNSIVLDTNNAYNSGTFNYTAPVSGVYDIFVQARIEGGTSGVGRVFISINSVLLDDAIAGVCNFTTGNAETVSTAYLIRLRAGDTISGSVFQTVPGGNRNVSSFMIIKKLP